MTQKDKLIIHVHHGALLLVPQRQCISSFVFYMCRRDINKPHTEFKLISKNKITMVVYQDFGGWEPRVLMRVQKKASGTRDVIKL